MDRASGLGRASEWAGLKLSKYTNPAVEAPAEETPAEASYTLFFFFVLEFVLRLARPAVTPTICARTELRNYRSQAGEEDVKH